MSLLTKIEDEYNKFIRKNTDISMVLKRNNNNKIIISLNELDIEINYPKNYPDNDITESFSIYSNDEILNNNINRYCSKKRNLKSILKK